MPISPFDIAIILISSVACLYCIVLSRRLQALQNTKNGIGATIRALSDSISAVSATTDETRYHAGELATRLAHLIEDSRSSCARMEDLIHRLEQSAAEAHRAAPARSSQSMPSRSYEAPQRPEPPTVEEADEKLREISALMERLKDLTEASVAAAAPTSSDLRPLPTQLRPRMKVV
ncbi:MAG: hypothetical protein AAFZ74_10515 [Pseudomonadota bacterium]